MPGCRNRTKAINPADGGGQLLNARSSSTVFHCRRLHHTALGIHQPKVALFLVQTHLGAPPELCPTQGSAPRTRSSRPAPCRLGPFASRPGRRALGLRKQCNQLRMPRHRLRAAARCQPHVPERYLQVLTSRPRVHVVNKQDRKGCSHSRSHCSIEPTQMALKQPCNSELSHAVPRHAAGSRRHLRRPSRSGRGPPLWR